MIRNNSFEENAGPQLQGTYADTRIIGNLMRNLGCAEGALYSRNVYIPFSDTVGSRPCGASDRRVRSFAYVNGSSFDYHVKLQSPAVNAGDSKSCPANDIDGNIEAFRPPVRRGGGSARSAGLPSKEGSNRALADDRD